MWHAGPLLCAGKELATAASKALDMELEFEDISEYVLTHFHGLPFSTARIFSPHLHTHVNFFS
jgi:hypothetical protein